MVFGHNDDSFYYHINTDLSKTFPDACRLQTSEQKRSFELLRLASFALKLRKLECSHTNSEASQSVDYEYRCNLLRHAIFQQVLALSALDARHQALQLINACNYSTQS